MEKDALQHESLAQLKQRCKERGLKGYHSKKKGDIIELLVTPSTVQDADFVFQPMITYIGNKRKLVPWIMDVVAEIQQKHGRLLRAVDGFAGSGVVSRALLPFCSELHSNDMEYYSSILLRCFLISPMADQHAALLHHQNMINALEPIEGWVTRLYAPQNTDAPVAGERCFYTRENAMRIDAMLRYIFEQPSELLPYLLGPLLVKASINVNTAGVFRGFYKKDGVGHFGGAGENALERILAPIEWSMPIWSETVCKTNCHCLPIQDLMLGISNVDLIYLDPPYNEHPYGSNYFMLNLLARGQEPKDYSTVSGIPAGWNKSAFNGRGSALGAMRELLTICLQKATYVLLSYNNEGLITAEQWTALFLELDCTVKIYEKNYDTYHGSRNRSDRSQTVVERMYLLQKLT